MQTNNEAGASGWVIALAAAALACLPPPALPAQEASGSRDVLEPAAAWHLEVSDDVKASVHPVAGALCIDFDFGRVSGYVAVRRELQLSYPGNYEFSLDVRGDAPRNGFQLKLLDASGENVWWVNRPAFDFSREWQHSRFTRGDIGFAWGPAADHALRASAALELVIARGTGGGRGTVCFRHLAFGELAPDQATELPPALPLLQASSSLPDALPALAIDGREDTAWRSDPAAGPDQFLTFDFVRPRELGGLVLHWLPESFAHRYEVAVSDDGRSWRVLRRVKDSNGGIDPLLLTGTRTRYLRLHLQEGAATSYGLAEIELEPPGFGASPNAFFEALAARSPRGYYPRGFSGEQSYWTVVGVDGGAAKGLLSEDGALELGAGLPAVEPFVTSGGTLTGWAQADGRQSLAAGYLPVPQVRWLERDWQLSVTVFGAGSEEHSELVADYTIRNLSAAPLALTLALAVRPFQVNPPTQFLNGEGGVAPIGRIAWDGEALSVNGERRLFPLDLPQGVILADFDAGNMPDILAGSPCPPSAGGAAPCDPHASTAQPRAVSDETGFASGALLYRLELPPQGERRIGVVVPLGGRGLGKEARADPRQSAAPVLPSTHPVEWRDRLQRQVEAQWRTKLERVDLLVPEAAQPLAQTLRSALAQILLERNKPALQPGTRAYARSWIRDGAMMADALHRLGESGVAREFADWFVPNQFSSGKVPCCVDARGADPVVENDSPGEFIHLIAQQYRYGGDLAWLQRMWSHVDAALAYMDKLRTGERTARNREDARRAFFGLLPPSISHEGYSDRPAWSYWDDFWGIAGYDGARAIAAALGRKDDAVRISAARDQFVGDVRSSLSAAMVAHKLNYLPASADRGDFDPTSTTIALTVAPDAAGPEQALRGPLRETFERYWTSFVDRRDGRTPWDDYTPYELRNVSAFVRLGWRQRANELLDFFLRDRRPPGWNQWAEVVGRDPRKPRFVGDMPHAWVAADFIQAVLDLFAYVDSGDVLVIGAGIPDGWFAGRGCGIARLRTPYGLLSYTLKRDGDRLLLEIGPGVAPPGGIVFRWPFSGPAGDASIDGQPARWSAARELHIPAAPASVVMSVRDFR